MAYSRRYKKQNRGMEFALRHVEEARKLSQELGGNDKDVKDWFFSKSKNELQEIFTSYRNRYGNKAADYAEEAFPEWKAQRRQMSGLVASRLFSLLPSFMPIEDKYKLVESLWNHVGPKRKRLVLAGRNANKDELISEVTKEVHRITTQWTIPAELSVRFNWLSGDDSEAYQLLLSHIKHHERDLGQRTLHSHLPELGAKFADSFEDYEGTFSYTMEVGKQSVEVRLQGDNQEVRVSDWSPIPSISSTYKSAYSQKADAVESIWLVFTAIVVAIMLFSIF